MLRRRAKPVGPRAGKNLALAAAAIGHDRLAVSGDTGECC
jgi:hypothetical protein